MCACMYVHIYTHTPLHRVYLCKGNTNSKMLRQKGVTQSQKIREKKSKPCLIQDFLTANAGLLFAKAGRKFKRMGDKKESSPQGKIKVRELKRFNQFHG